MKQQIEAHAPALALLEPGVLDTPVNPKSGRIPMSATVHLLQAISMLAEWSTAYDRGIHFDSWPVALN
jgi:hypothetical protein